MHDSFYRRKAWNQGFDNCAVEKDRNEPPTNEVTTDCTSYQRLSISTRLAFCSFYCFSETLMAFLEYLLLRFPLQILIKK